MSDAVAIGQVLVSGAAGWLGMNLVQTLVRGQLNSGLPVADAGQLKLRTLVLPADDVTRLRAISSRMETVSGDLRNADDCAALCAGAKGATLFHLAGIIHPRRVRDFYEVNVEATRRLLSAAAQAGVRRAVVVSSNSPCGCNPDPGHRFDEDSPYQPYMHYGRSKMMMEELVREFHQSGRLETVIVRAPWFYGPFQPARQELFFRMIRDGRGPVVGDGENQRSMAYTENLAQGLWLAGTIPQAAGRLYWIADERPYTMNEIIDTIERLMETEFKQTCAHRRLRLPSVASEVAWVVDKTLQGCGLYHQKIHVLSEMNKTIACSVERAKKELGYRPVISLEEGMRRSLSEAFGR